MKRIILAALALALGAPFAAAGADVALPSWNDGPARQAILAFVSKVTDAGSSTYVPPAERIATFDNDGTLWVEKPLYAQMFFALDRLRALAPKHPEWMSEESLAPALKGNPKAALEGGEKAVMEIVMATHAGMTTAEFEKAVKDWMAVARHPRYKKPFDECVYQPMLELLAYLRANGFKTFIVSGGGVEFMRPWTEATYGIPPEQVVGSSVKMKYEMRDSGPVIVRLPQVNFVDDKEGKPVGIQQYIARRPIAAFGNSDGDQQMLEWTQAGGGARLMMLVHHDDRQREYAYDADSKIGTFSDELKTKAKANGWTVISMKNDWKRVFPF